MSGLMPYARTLLTTLLLALNAIPAHAAPAASAGNTGGSIALTDTGGNLLWPGDGSTPQAPVTPLNPLLDLLPGLQAPDPALVPVTSVTVPGTVARLRTDGTAAIPLGAPKRVRRLISQYNKIVGKRYRWGGGHAVVDDKAYDCSGAVGYALIKTGMLRTTMVSGSFARWAAAGEGRWMTIYATREHVYTEIAGLRLDTSPVGDRGGAHGVRWRPVIGKRDGFHVRHPIGL
jgi:cell wall-associated NlpC family hydrolase